MNNIIIKIYFFSFILFIHFVSTTDAQDLRGGLASHRVYYRYPIEVTIGNHAVTTPFRKMIRKPIHPAISIGTEVSIWRDDPHHIFAPVKLSFFYNKYSTYGGSINTGIAYRYLFDFGLFADIGVELGYLHTVRPIKKLRFKDGIYKKQGDFGKPSVMITNFMSLGYDFYPKMKIRWAIFMRYTPFGQLPYNSVRGLWYPQAIIALGIRYQPTWGLGPNCPPNLKRAIRTPKPKRKKKKARSKKVVG